MNNIADTHKLEEWRNQAKENLAQQNLPDRLPVDSDPRKLLHELHVHQIELEMQNNELRRAQAELEDSRILYRNLYDLAPYGDCTLDDEGVIMQANIPPTQRWWLDQRQCQGIDEPTMQTTYSPALTVFPSPCFWNIRRTYLLCRKFE